MADRAREKGRTERYLPKAAWASMTKEERKATDDKKKRYKSQHRGREIDSSRIYSNSLNPELMTCPYYT